MLELRSAQQVNNPERVQAKNRSLTLWLDSTMRHFDESSPFTESVVSKWKISVVKAAALLHAVCLSPLLPLPILL